MLFKKKRLATAIAFKGKATKGTLTPKKMGKNGDQIVRLFDTATQIFLIVYQGTIDESVINQMEAYAFKKSAPGKTIYYGVIDENDLSRIINSYPKYFT